MARGKLPRTYKLSDTNPNYLDAHLYDSALAIIATIGANAKSLAYEIVNGSLLSDAADNPLGSVPVVADNTDASPVSDPDYAKNNINAILAYALGFYLELYPSTPDSCEVVRTIRQLLATLESQRDFVYKDGLIMAGYDALGVALLESYTEDNLLAYFAFKQAASALNEPNYTLTANELATAIVSKLFTGTKFIKGLTSTGTAITDDLLINTALGAMFFNELGNPTNAGKVLENASTFKIIDASLGIEGYKATTSATKIWFEGSYALATAFYKVGNTATHKAITAALNKYVDKTDGGVIGTITKDSGDATNIALKGIGSTAWSIIANILQASAFTIRTITNAVTGCSNPYFNTEQEDDFTKTGCGTGYTPSVETYTVRAGRYISYVDQASANNLALAEITAYGQAYANVHGTCSGQVGNQLQSQVFYSTVCPSNTTAQAYTYTVPANTYFAGTQNAANQLALNDIAANGQAAANANGICQLNTLSIHLTLYSSSQFINGSDNVYIEVASDAAVTDLITMGIRGNDGMGSMFVFPSVSISEGESTTGQVFIGSFPPGQGANITIEIYNVFPNPDAAGTNYIF